jgi:pyruvate dehydrogenase E1 component beta subunit
MAKKPYTYAQYEAVAFEMRKNPNSVLFYEWQYPVATTATGEIIDLVSEFGSVRTSGVGWAIDEDWQVGAALGVAITGVPAIVHYGFMVTVFPIEIIFNQIAKLRHMTGGQANLPLVLWVDGASRAGGMAGQHTDVGQETMYANIPGLKVVAPSNAYDAKGLMHAAIRAKDPIAYWDYPEVASGAQPDVPDDDYEVPIGKAAVRQEGKDITLVAWAPATVEATLALPELSKAGISVEFIDLRTLKPMDLDTLLTSVKKTGKLLVVEHGHYTAGFSANVVAEVAAYAPGAKVARIAFPDLPGPGSAEMMNWARPDAPKIVDAVKRFV